MNTIFTVTIMKGVAGMEKGFTVDLGQDILEGKSDATIRTMATQSAIISAQAPLRKKNTAAEMQEYLKKTFPDATVDEGVVRTASETSVLNKAIKAIGKDKVADILNKILNGEIA